MPRTPREMEALIRENGWIYDRQRGSHKHFKHPTKKGLVTIPVHKGKTLRPDEERSILRQAGLISAPSSQGVHIDIRSRSVRKDVECISCVFLQGNKRV